ncbi:MAG: UDP-N-acetylglucosamine 2-epimerase [Aquabacterium sp.]
MYERQFGITGPPFQLSPDPSFYFDGHQHRVALATLRLPFSAEAPFILLSGEIGAGKTTVLHTWTDECRHAGNWVAQLANTQLDAPQLRDAIAVAFGLDPAHWPAGDADDAWRAFFRTRAGGATVLSIDEAQNLDGAALLSLLPLARAATAEGVSFRIVLSGQPELRLRVSARELPAVHARLLASCHLAPLDGSQTRHYIEHRLRKVGWRGQPSFDDAAFAVIHDVTGGLPRRINVMANRLLLGQFLNHTMRIEPRDVRATAQALDAEFGGVTVSADLRGASLRAALAPTPRGGLLVLAQGRSGHIKASALMHAAARQPGLPVCIAMDGPDGAPWQPQADTPHPAQRVALDEGPSDAPAGLDPRFTQLLRAVEPKAVLVIDGNPFLARCAGLAAGLGLPVVHIGADAQTLDERRDPQAARATIRRLARLCFGSATMPPPQAGTAGHVEGSLLVDAVRLAWDAATARAARSGKPLTTSTAIDQRLGYGVVALRPPLDGTGLPTLPGIVPLLREVSRDLPLVWPMGRDTMRLAHASGLARTIEGDRIARIEELGYVDYVRLLRDATCVLTDSANVVEEAAALAVPCLNLGAPHVAQRDAGGWMPVFQVGAHTPAATRAVWQILFRGTDDLVLPADWDGHAGSRIARHLASWLATLDHAAAPAAGMHRPAMAPAPATVRNPTHRSPP